MATFTATVEATQWFPGVEIPGVEPETTELKGGEPEVTHGLTLPLGRPPFALKEKAKVGDTVVRRGCIHGPEGHTVLVHPGDWVVKHPAHHDDPLGWNLEVFTDDEFKAKFGKGQ